MILCFIILIQTLFTIRTTNFVIWFATGNMRKLFENPTTRTFKFFKVIFNKKTNSWHKNSQLPGKLQFFDYLVGAIMLVGLVTIYF